jgi:hypothetical protein
MNPALPNGSTPNQRSDYRGPLIHWTQLPSIEASLRRPTTITVTEKTRRLLEAVNAEDESFDDMLQGLLEETFYDDDFYQEIQRRW